MHGLLMTVYFKGDRMKALLSKVTVEFLQFVIVLKCLSDNKKIF